MFNRPNSSPKLSLKMIMKKALNFEKKEKSKNISLKKIPQELYDFWFLEYNEDLRDQITQIIELPDKKLISNLKNFKLKNHDKAKAWLVIAMTRQNPSHRFLKSIAKKLELSHDTLFQYTAIWGNLDFLRTLGNQFNLEVFALASRNALQFDHFDIVRYVEQISPTNPWKYFQKPIRNKAYDSETNYKLSAIKDSELKIFLDRFTEKIIESGQLHVLTYLVEKLPNQISTHLENMVKTAMISKNVEVLKYLQQKMPKEKFHALISKVAGNSLEILLNRGFFETFRYLLSTLSPTQIIEYPTNAGLKQCIRLVGYKTRDNALNIADKSQYADLFKLLVKHPYYFAYATEVKSGFDDVRELVEIYIRPLIYEQIALLQKQRNNLENRKKFDVDDLTALKCYYMIRYFIRHPEEENALEHMHFLLNIPAVRVLADQNPVSPIIKEVSHNQHGLITLALSVNNLPAVKMLLDIPSVRDAALHSKKQGKVQKIKHILNEQIEQEIKQFPEVQHTLFMGLFGARNTSSLNKFKREKMFDRHLTKEILDFAEPAPKIKKKVK